MQQKRLKNLFNDLKLTDTGSILWREEFENKEIISNTEVRKKLAEISPDAVYVFNHLPYILFFDLSEKLDEEEKIHKQVWSFDQAPVIFIIKNTDIAIYNAFAYEKNKGLQLLDLTLEERNKQFSFWNLQSGKAFEDFFEKYKKTIKQKRVNQQLFDNIKQTIALITDSIHGLDDKIAKILVLRLIFVRYLIDRKIKIDTKYIFGNEDDVLQRRKSFSDLISRPSDLHDFFVYLNVRFNGVLFKDSDIELTPIQSALLSKLFSPDGVTAEDKIHLFSNTDFEFQFDIFDFGIIPVELISGIYETLLDEDTKNATSAIYTPPFLVNYILDQTIDKYFEENPTKSECKIFDPAMGSGIFLVQGLRRMIEREKEINPNLTNGALGKRIRTIAENCLYGIDINEEAINVACFSIYVALLDSQDPGNIGTYIFPNLKDRNFHKVDFFNLEKKDILDKIKNENLQFILGNPPWKGGTKNSTKEHLDWLKQTKFDKIVSDVQIAQSYLIRVKDFVADDTKIALIVTSKVLYNNKAQKFKKYFFEKNAVSEIFDMSSVRHLVFKEADNPGAIIFFNLKINSFDNTVKHISLKQNIFFNSYTQNVVIEKFDTKEILQKHFLSNQWLLKVALYGNTLDYVFLNRFKDGTKLNSVFKKNKIAFSKGVFRGTPKRYFTELIGMPILRRKEFNEIFTDYKNGFNKIDNDTCYLEAGRTLDLFKGKKIILQKSVSVDFKFSLVDFDCVFDSTVYGINFQNNENLLNVFIAYLFSNFYTYYQYLTSAGWGVYIPEVYKVEHANFPFIEPNETQKTKLLYLVDVLLKPYKDHYAENAVMVYNGEPNKEILDKINKIINEIYNIKGYELDLIDYVLNVSRYQFQDSKQYLVSDFNEGDHRNKKNVLEQYASIYKEEFEKIYDENYFYTEVYELEHFIAMNFIISEEKLINKKSFEIIYEGNDEQKLFEKISSLSISNIASSTDNEQNIFIQKDIKGFEEDSFYIIKPKEYKCWHRAMAWYDVAEFKEAIQRAELERLNQNTVNV